jgi:spore coat protein JB
MSKDELMRRIQELSFAKVETELFLDTHPECKLALDFYRKTTDELDMAMTEYQNKYGPIVADASMGDHWTWIEGSWPWHMNGTETNHHMEGKR